MKPRTIYAPNWLTARPIAHRGLHSEQNGIVENTIAAATAAIAKNYAIECDIQLTKDGEAVVFHDPTLDRLMQAQGRVDGFSVSELARLSYKSGDKIVSLMEFLNHVDGRAPVVVDIKSHYDGDMRIAGRAMATAANYSGPVCLKSFDPEVLIYLRREGASCPVGLIARAGDDEEWAHLRPERRKQITELRDYLLLQSDFLSWNHGDLPHAVPILCRGGLGLPVMTWAVRSEADGERAKLYADQIIFEGYEP